MSQDIKPRIGLQQRLELRLKLSVQLTQSLEILQLPLLELTTLIKQEIEENPTVELTETTEPPEEETTPSKDVFDDKLITLKILDEERGDYIPSYSKGRRGDSFDSKSDVLQNTLAQTATLQDYIYQQFILMGVSEKERLIGRNIIYNLDNHGLLPVPVEEIALMSQSTPDEVSPVLKIIQQLDPPGIGAQSLKEQLLLQLNEADPNFELKRELISNHLEDINQNKMPLLAEGFKLSIEELKIALDEIKELHLQPTLNFSGEKSFYIVPDVIVQKIEGKYEIKLNEAFIPKLSISQYYREVLSNPAAQPELKNFVRQKIERAQMLIGAIHLRQNTLYRIVHEIISTQQDFLDYGPTRLKPLAMAEIANRLGLHLSTISRTVARKYMQTPQGIFNMKFFFARLAGSTHSDKKVQHHVMDTLKELIASEDKQQPLSDEAITQALKLKGIDVARRTVAAYRENLNIPSAHKRKQY